MLLYLYICITSLVNYPFKSLAIWKIVLSSSYWVISILYIQVLYRIYDLQIFSPSHHILVISVGLPLHILPESISFSFYCYYQHSGSSLLGHPPTLVSTAVFSLPHLRRDLDWPTVQSVNSSWWAFKNAECIISPPCITSFKGSPYRWHQTQASGTGP